MKTAEQLIEELNTLDEHTSIEAKTASEIGTSVMETVCAFSNEPHLGGGYIILGVAPAANSFWPIYEAVGVPDADRLQQEIATQCASMFNVTVRPKIVVELIGSKKVVTVSGHVLHADRQRPGELVASASERIQTTRAGRQIHQPPRQIHQPPRQIHQLPRHIHQARHQIHQAWRRVRAARRGRATRPAISDSAPDRCSGWQGYFGHGAGGGGGVAQEMAVKKLAGYLGRTLGYDRILALIAEDVPSPPNLRSAIDGPT